MRTGRRLAIDVGKVRIGLATSDQQAILASPHATLDRDDFENNFSAMFSAVEDLEQYLEIYVGLPLNLQGNVTESTEDAVMFAESLAQHTSVPILLIDERLTTAISNQQIRQVGKSQKDARSIIDQMAAVAILEYAFQVEMNSGQRPGLPLNDWREQNVG